MKANLLPVVLLFAMQQTAIAESPYAGEEANSIKSLSAAEITALRAGRGMGFAKLAELNGYPGPRHVLELAAELELSDAQRADSEALFADMQAAAVRLGEELIVAEALLDKAFADGSIDRVSLESRLLEIGAIRARLRYVHMAAHLQQASLLSEAQRAAYNVLRGYR